MAMAEKHLVIAAGGTGGHMFPAAAFSEAMRRRGWRVTLVTDARGRRYAANFPADKVEDVPAATIQGRNPFKALAALFTIRRGLAAARKRLRTLDPALVAGFGGYPSLPALWAARALRTPILIHEQNSVLGRVNRIFAADAAVVASGFPRLGRLPARAAGRHQVVGNPVRPPIVAARAEAYPLAPAGGRLHLLVIGGSQGARVFGTVIPEAILALEPALRRRLRVVQQVREEQVEEVRALYARAQVEAEVAPFFHRIAEHLAAAHLVVARAGASTVTELLAVGRPAILVPLAIATDDHQTGNAAAMVEIGAADLLAEQDFSAARLAALLSERLGDPHQLAVRAAAAHAAGRVDAAEALADVAERIARA